MAHDHHQLHFTEIEMHEIQKRIATLHDGIELFV